MRINSFVHYSIYICLMLSQEIVIADKYLRKELLGNGGFAKCYLMLNIHTNQKFAGKVIKKRQLKDKSSKAKVIQQSDIHKCTDHSNIVKLFQAFQWQGEYYMIMELCQNNSLKEFLRSRIRITEIEVKCYLLQIIQGLAYLHSCGIIHRDIKLGNIFLNYKMQVKIGDFGLSTKVKSTKERRYTTCGTPNYIAPQILSEIGHSFEVDVWAVGIIVYALLIGKPPFQSQTVDQTYKRIKINSYDFPKQIPLSSQAKSIIKTMLDPSPKTRISLSNIKNHQFLANQNIPPLLPPYTISLPPQNIFLKQYGSSQKCAKLTIYPIKLSSGPNEDLYSSNSNIKQKTKFNRVLSCDKNVFKMLSDSKYNSKDRSQLNKGLFLNTKMKNQLKESSNSKFLVENMTSSRLNLYESDGNQIICYYDMSNKYGIGYLLSNGSFGVIFNDQTSLTSISDSSLLYFAQNKEHKFKAIAENMKKKHEILKYCMEKMNSYKEKNILIPFDSEVYVKKFTKLREMFVIKLSNGVIQFFWTCDVITVRGFKWVKWRIQREEGQSALNSASFPALVQPKIIQIREFLRKQSQTSQSRRLKT